MYEDNSWLLSEDFQRRRALAYRVFQSSQRVAGQYPDITGDKRNSLIVITKIVASTLGSFVERNDQEKPAV